MKKSKRKVRSARRDVLEECFYQLATKRVIRLAGQQEANDVFDGRKLVVCNDDTCPLFEKSAKQADQSGDVPSLHPEIGHQDWREERLVGVG